MRCIINVSIGGRYPKEQERLRASLQGRFHGTTLMWSEFPNEHYNTNNPYNAKAAAFEEAIKQGYQKILWVDSPVVAMRDVSPIFEKIERDGYLTIRNGSYNCAQTCSDACLEYFNVTRDEAENMPEHAGGLIGINMANKKAAEMIKMFIRACKDGACDGSRKHDGQSSDPRFKFHRQCQSVISLCANAVGLPPNEIWDTGPITLHPNKRTSKTILCWSHRGHSKLPIGAEGTSRPQPVHAGESFIYVISLNGFNDALTHLGICTQYAINHKYSIIWEIASYAATDVSTIFDVSKYPVPLYLNAKEKMKELESGPFEPEMYKSIAYFQEVAKKAKKFRTEPASFDIHKIYPREKVLLYSSKGGGGYMLPFNTFKHLRFTPQFLQTYRNVVRSIPMPAEYVSIHLRATDRKLQIMNNVNTMGKAKPRSKNVTRKNSKNTPIKVIEGFIHKHSAYPPYIATDNTHLLKTLKRKYPQILHTPATNKHNTSEKNGRLHDYGKTDSDNLRNALIDLLILAGGKYFLQTSGGFSRLANQLFKHKDILHKMLTTS